MGDDDVTALAELRGIRAHGAARRLAELIEENAALRRENRELSRFCGLAVDVAGSLCSAGERVAQSGSRAARSRPRS